MNTFIITAGGIGKRMGSKIPKQFIEVGSKPILMRTIEVFFNYDKDAQFLVTLPIDWWDFWKELCKKHNFIVKHEIIEGGKERFHSIANALQRAKGDMIGIHDGVRPFVSYTTIDKCLKTAKKGGAGVPVLPVKESIRKGNFTKSHALDRNSIYTVQTPQCFQKEILIASYSSNYNEGFTDDASVVENKGYPIQLVEGNEENIKITTPFDLRIAQIFLKE
jgi:2-C-methyl-D-erythritol 4-phosphate cytidylyltransferase